jgi:ActR/RegA family two-component response regulator
MDDLSHHSILVVETRLTPHVAHLQQALERVGAETVVARDADTAQERCRQFKFSAAVVNVEHRALAEQLGLPYILYAPTEKATAILATLARLLYA